MGTTPQPSAGAPSVLKLDSHKCLMSPKGERPLSVELVLYHTSHFSSARSPHRLAWFWGVPSHSSLAHLAPAFGFRLRRLSRSAQYPAPFTTNLFVRVRDVFLTAETHVLVLVTYTFTSSAYRSGSSLILGASQLGNGQHFY